MVYGDDTRFAMLTLVVMFVIILLSPDVGTGLILVGLVAAYYVAAVRHHSRRQRTNKDKAGFSTLPGPSTPYPVYASSFQEPPTVRYPGAIDVDEFDSEGEYGHRDRTAGDNAIAPPGNPYNLSRISAPTGAEPCIDDEANDDTLDGDEKITYQARSRNDATRVAAGTMNRRRDLDKYLREEVEQEDDREWWTRHEI